MKNTASDSKFTVGIVGPLPPPIGGMATQTAQLLELLGEEGIATRIVQTNMPYSPKWIGKFRGLRAFVRLISYVVRLWALSGQVNVIHLMANSGWSWQLFSAPAVWIAWLRKTPLIVNYRGGEAAEYFSRSISWVRPTMQKAGKIVVPSPYLEEIFRKYGFEAEVIPNIVNLERFKPDQSPPPDMNPHFTLIVTRNLEAIYGLPTAIRALALAKKTIPSIELLIAGTGPEKQTLLNLARQLGVGDQVRFVGRLGPGEIEGFYQAADVMLNPTTVDNMPNSVLEALASGVPVVSTDVGGIPYIVEHQKTALLVAVNDHQAMARQIVCLYREEETRLNLIGAGLREAAQYGWPKIKHHWLDAYQSLQVKS